jgi:hypothetical protein
MRVGLFALGLIACDAGMPATKPEPARKLVEVPAPRDAGAPVVVDAAGPTPALASARLRLNQFDLPPQAECTRTRLVLSLVDKKTVLDDYRENSTCTGACTDKDKRDAAEEVERLTELVDKGETSSVLDYNFTGCLETGLGETAIFHKVGGRDVALITDRYIGPHDGVYDRYKIALEVCGKIFVSNTFGEVQSHSWPMERLSITSEKDGEITVQGTGDTAETTGTLLDLRLPACPGAPVQQTFDIWPIPT